MAVVQFSNACLACRKPSVRLPVPLTLGVVAPETPTLHAHPQLPREFEARLGYKRSCLFSTALLSPKGPATWFSGLKGFAANTDDLSVIPRTQGEMKIVRFLSCSACVRACVHVHVPQLADTTQKMKVWQSVFYFYHVGPKDGTRVLRLESKWAHLLHLLTHPLFFISYGKSSVP